MDIQSCADDGEEDGETCHGENVVRTKRRDSPTSRDFIAEGLNRACSTNTAFHLPCARQWELSRGSGMAYPDLKHVRLSITRSYHEMRPHETILQ